MGEEFAEGSFFGAAVCAGVEDEGGIVAKFGEGLAAGSAGHRSRAVEVRDGDGAEADARAMFCNGARDGSLFGATGEAVGAVFDVAAGDDGAIFKQEGRADAKFRIRGIGVLRGGHSEAAEVGALLRGEGFGMRCLRHGESIRVSEAHDSKGR